MTTRETELLMLNLTQAGEQISQLQSANAALELEVVRLRSVMVDVIKAHGYAGGTPVEAMSTQFTPAALPKLIKKVENIWREKCARECERFEYPASREAEAIRALPTGQIKLEELL